ncbi:hypothetical protein TWF481_003140 [Arthrobotrys musiformis]|uniref:Peptidase S8/S53 domain-containing protein n=1 Tax=Arthrobotrys musiformis TaxID=47236 RepID=A0AAV9VSE2_9PEZI
MWTFQLLYLIALSLLQYRPAAAVSVPARKREVAFHEKLKIGTAAPAIDYYLCLIRKEEMKNPTLVQSIKGIVDESVSLAPPRKHTLRWIESEELGKLGFTFEALPTSRILFQLEVTAVGQALISSCNRVRSDLRIIRYGGTDKELQPFDPIAEEIYDFGGGKRPGDVKPVKPEILDSGYKKFLRKLVGFLKMPFGNSISRILATVPVEARNTTNWQLDMRVLSQPPGTTAEDSKGMFWNFQYPGWGQLVYVLEGGFNMQHKETRHIHVEKMIFAGPLPADDGYTGAELPNVDHGTAVVAKIAGRNVGVATNATLVLARTTDSTGTMDYAAFIDILLKVYDDVRKRDPKQICIINISLVLWIPNTDYAGVNSVNQKSYLYLVGNRNKVAYLVFYRAVRTALDHILENLMRLPNVFIVAAAGNENPKVPINTWPATRGEYYANSSRFIVVGGYAPGYGENIFQIVPYVPIWAPGGWVNIPTRWKYGDFEDPKYTGPPIGFHREFELSFSSGTSFATPTVTGMIAAWLSIGIKPKDIVPFMKTAYQRVKYGVKALYNGIPLSRWPKADRPAWYNAKKSTPPPPDTLDIPLTDQQTSPF